MVKIERLLILMIFLAGCYMNVPHDSPKDPENPFGQGTVNVTVLRKDGTPVRDVLVSLNGVEKGLTGSDGRISIDAVQNGLLTVECHKAQYEDFTEDTILVTGEGMELAVRLDYIPLFCSSKVYSAVEKIVDFTDTLRYSIHYSASVKDLDGRTDIRSVMLGLPDSLFEMRYDSSADSIMFYSLSITDTSFPNIYDLQGFPAEAFVYDSSSRADTSAEMIVIRFVEEVPQIISPTEGGSLIPPDTIVWDAPSGIYASYINLIILKDETEIFRAESLDVESYKYVITEFLFPGEYRLLCRMCDMFSDYSQNEVNFIVP